MSPSIPKLRLEHDLFRGGCLIRLAGTIDESFDVNAFWEGVEGVVVVDLDEVRGITSYGVREWVRAVKDLPCEYLGFVRCRPAMVSQFNMVANFGGRGQLLSLFAAYVCRRCRKEVEQLIDVRQEHEAVRTFTPPLVTCPECQEEAELDDLPQVYFSYAAARPAPMPPFLVDVMLSGKAPPAHPLRVEKEVEGTVTALWLSGGLDRSASFKRLSDGLEGTVVVIAQDITHVTEAGVERFTQFLASVQAPLFVALVPPRLMRVLAQGPGVGGATVASVLLPFECTRCSDRMEMAVGAAWLEALVSGAPGGRPCRTCAGPLKPRSSREDLEAASRLPVRPVPAEVETFHGGALAGLSGPLPAESGEHAAEVFGRFKLVRKLRTGELGELWSALQSGAGGFEKRVALKRLAPHLCSDPELVSVFLQEVRRLARLSHPNLVTLLDVGEVDGRYFLSLEHVSGWDLEQVLRACRHLGRPAPVEVAAHLIAQVCAGLNAAHTQVDEASGAPIVHGRLAARHVLISPEGVVKVTGFGLHRVHAVAERSTSTHPERTKAGEAEVRSDILRAGLMLWQLSTLQRMPQGAEPTAMQVTLQDLLPRPAGRALPLPRSIQEMIDRACARGPHPAYASARALQSDLERFLRESGKEVGPELVAWLQALDPAAPAAESALAEDRRSTRSGSSPLRSDTRGMN